MLTFLSEDEISSLGNLYWIEKIVFMSLTIGLGRWEIMDSFDKAKFSASLSTFVSLDELPVLMIIGLIAELALFLVKCGIMRYQSSC